MTEQSHGSEISTLEELLVPMKLPGDVELEKARPAEPFPPEVRRELERKLAESARMVIDLRR